MKTIAVVTISFERLEIPARVYAAVESKSEIKFSLLHDSCKSKLKQQYACPKCDDGVVERDEMLKGYEFAKGRFVTFSEKELEELDELEPAKPANQTIAISHFVKASGSVRFAIGAAIERCYFVGPNEGSERPYVTLLQAMKRADVHAVGQYTARGRTHQVLLAEHLGCFEMVQLRGANEIRSAADVAAVDVEPAAENVELAVKLIAQYMRDELELDLQADAGQLRLQEQIQQKIDGGEIAAAPTANGTPIVDLCEALEASLNEKKKRARRAGTP